jgi:hypothetical protein
MPAVPQKKSELNLCPNFEKVIEGDLEIFYTSSGYPDSGWCNYFSK